jgi:hypothetical protein
VRRPSTTLTFGLCIETLRDTLGQSGTPWSSNSDQAWQFAGEYIIKAQRDCRMRIKMDGRGGYHDRFFPELFGCRESQVDLYVADHDRRRPQGLRKQFFLLIYSALIPPSACR